ncbi:MAG: hypothetical protein CO093_11390 [Alphaproteobacteria bacterium CG_4_9_14_3_um_filter_47_13]|nr:MAG: hypothetical protein CO093_11390 [Alphaproteobacteria bacterium CG_4_9_14_3_um_filter_47_13]
MKNELGQNTDKKDLLGALGKRILKTVLPKDENNEAITITLRDVFNALAAKNGNDEKVIREYKHISHNTIAAARELLIARFPNLYADHIAGKSKTPHYFLIDANLSTTLSTGLWHEFGRATHTKYEGLSTCNDQDVWQWAIRHKLSSIITCDKRMSDHTKDLGAIAVKHTHDILYKNKTSKASTKAGSLPLLIQIPSESELSKQDLLQLHRKTIMQHLENRTTPYIFLNEKECIIGPTYEELARHSWETIKSMTKDIWEKTRPQTCPSASPS